ncbi:MAG: hypothetical protein ACI9VS_003974, partial [Candidatus Binatia bacterium]
GSGFGLVVLWRIGMLLKSPRPADPSIPSSPLVKLPEELPEELHEIP